MRIVNDLKIPKQISIRLDEDIYLLVKRLSEHQNQSIAKVVNDLIRQGMINNSDSTIFEYLDSKINKIIAKQNLDYDLLVQLFVNKGFGKNYDFKNDLCYTEFLDRRRKDKFND